MKTLSGMAFVLFGILFGSSVRGQEVELRILDEQAPAGGWAVIGIAQDYEPRPIGGGQGCFTFGGTSLIDEPRIVVENETGDVTFRIDDYKPGMVLFSFETPSNNLGLDERPFIFIAMQVRPDAPSGTSEVLSFDTNRTFLIDHEGNFNRPRIRDGQFTVGGLSISCISPSTGVVRRGQEVTLYGVGFRPGLEVRFDRERSRVVQFRDSNTVTAIAPVDFTAENVSVQVVNPNENRNTFVMRRFGCLGDSD